MRVLLVYPHMPNTFWTMNYSLRISGKKAWYPPLNLLTIAAMLPKDWDLRLVDLNVRPLTDNDLSRTDYVFIGAMNVQEDSVRDIISRCQQAKVKIIAGGPLFTHESNRFSGIDTFILNEAELTLAAFLADVENGQPKHVYSSQEFADLETTPVPRWDLIDLKDYQYGIVQYSRGCPFQCDFCDVTSLYGHGQRTKNPDQIIAELELILQKDHVPTILFADDNIIGNKRTLKQELLPVLIEWRRQKSPAVSFSTQASINLADDPELMQKMLEAGFRHLFVGLETPEQECLLAHGKQQNTRRDLLENISRLHKAGFILVAGFVAGFDTDTFETFQRQIDFIQNSGIVLTTVNLLKAPPGTTLYDRMKQEGRLLDMFSFHELKSNFLPKMDPDLLKREFYHILHAIYSPEYSYKRAQKFILEHDKDPKLENRIPSLSLKKYLGTLCRCIYYVGIINRERWYFWKLIYWTMRNRIQLVDWAIMTSMMIYQLQNLVDYYKKVEFEDGDYT